jgi:hypothetical protein
MPASSQQTTQYPHFMKHVQRRSRAEFELIILSYAPRRRAVSAQSRSTYQVSGPECKTGRSSINGARNYLPSLQYPSAIRDRSRGSRERTQGHSRKIATMAMDTATAEQIIRDGGDRRWEAHNHLRIMSRQMDRPNPRQCPCLCSLPYRELPLRRKNNMASTWTQFLHCPHHNHYG